MNDYYLVRFTMVPCREDDCDILSALLGDAGFESFTADDNGVSAYIPARLLSEENIRTALTAYDFGCDITFRTELIKGQDWNSEWEKHYFNPIVFANKCVVHSSFHKDYPAAEYDIVIDPKMAFGTGHHETTSMMMERLLSADINGLSVLDVGTGTGILAILAAMRGAKRVVGIEIDPPAYDNACDNIRLNGTPNIQLRRGGAEMITESAKFDLLLANINRNIILNDIARYAQALVPGGKMLLSGFYTSDIPIIEDAARPYGLTLTSTLEKKNWANICLEKHLQ